MTRPPSGRHRHWPPSRALPFALGLALALVLDATPPARAEQADREKPINYSSDTGDVNYQTKVGSLAGNVIITQGTMTIRADRIVFRQNPDNSLSATAYGSPVSFRQKRDGHDEYFEGYAQRAEYDGTREFLELFDQAILRRGADEIRSNYISYNAATEVFKAEGRAATTPAAEAGGPGARVRGVFQPRSDAPLPGKGRDAPKTPAKDAPAAPPATLKGAAELAPRPAQ